MSTSGRVTRFGLRNFKAFRYLDDIELKPLTVLVGANSTGKSSIFQSLLLLKQSISASRSGMLNFDAYWTQLGSFSNVVSDFDASREIEYRFAGDIELDELTKGDFGASLIDPGVLAGATSARWELSFSFGVEKEDARVVLRQMDMKSWVTKPDGEEVLAKLNVDGVDEEGRAKQFKFDVPLRVDASLGLRFIRFLPGLIALGKKELDHDGSFQPINVPELQVPLTILGKLIDDQLEYLGPIRADPRPFYTVSLQPEIGLRGEGTIPYLVIHWHDQVRYVPSPTSPIQEATLLEALNDWLQRMKVTDRLVIDPVKSVALTAAIQSPSVPGRSVNLSQVGFGISQLLPVLVMGLKNPVDGWLLFEQPEIHLHPRLQGELSDFLLSVARAGRTVMVETHSDHLVNRLRRRIAEDTTGELAKMVQILFVHAGTPDDPGSYVEPLQVDESGNIVNCPPDFFSEGPDEAFAILHARRRKAGRP